MTKYQIYREHHSSNTFNGYTDAPYWWVTLEGSQDIGLKDSGEWWKISSHLSNEVIIEALENIISQCNLNIKLQERDTLL